VPSCMGPDLSPGGLPDYSKNTLDHASSLVGFLILEEHTPGTDNQTSHHLCIGKQI
jgi:hypothetical protein